jgi:hypothetical protein
MIENILYVVIGFVVTYISLELAWHFTACRIKDNKMRPCMFKEIKIVLMLPQTNPSRHSGKEGAKY